jgi:N-acyl-D-amino-acid deacylase
VGANCEALRRKSRLGKSELTATLFKNARIIDGSGLPSFDGELLITKGLITAISRYPDTIATSLLTVDAIDILDCEGLCLAPGFIDVHTHDDALMLQGNAAASIHPKLSQGVTTVITGNCGISLAPLIHTNPPAPLDILGQDEYQHASFDHYLAALEMQRPICNVGCLVGHTTLRVASGIDLQSEAPAAAQQWMAQQVTLALQQGALGLSTGVFYPPARAATTAELIAVCKPLAAFNAPVTMHLRDEADRLHEAMQEAFSVGQQAQCSVILSHHKVIGSHNAGTSRASLKSIEQAAQQQNVCLDCYPYDASSTMLLPERVAVSREILVTWSKADPSAAGQSLFTLAKQRGIDPQLLAQQLQPAGAVYFAMDESDVQRILSHPLTMIGSDGIAHGPAPHPRLWGSFPRVLGRYSRELKLFPLETAVHKMTGLSASRFGLDQQQSSAQNHRPARGRLQTQWAADLVLFDAATVADQATFAEPTLPSIGIHRVYVNGQLAALQGQTIAANAGHVLRNARYYQTT